MTNNDYSNIEDFMFNIWSNDWIGLAFCQHCGDMFSPDMSFNAYKIIKKEYYYDLFLCESCLIEIQKRNGISKKEKIELYWNSLQSSGPELQ